MLSGEIAIAMYEVKIKDEKWEVKTMYADFHL
jgi:hypothetical protein